VAAQTAVAMPRLPVWAPFLHDLRFSAFQVHGMLRWIVPLPVHRIFRYHRTLLQHALPAFTVFPVITCPVLAPRWTYSLGLGFWQTCLRPCASVVSFLGRCCVPFPHLDSCSKDPSNVLTSKKDSAAVLYLILLTVHECHPSNNNPLRPFKK
jgi:hypothetical protein